MTLYKVPYTHRAVPICEIDFRIFSVKIYEQKTINPLYGRYKFFGVHRVDGIQNDWLDLRIKDFFRFSKKRTVALDIHDLFFFNFTLLLISSARVRFFQNLNPKIEPVDFHTINPMNSKKFIMTL